MKEAWRFAMAIVMVSVLVSGCADSGRNTGSSVPAENVRILARGAEMDIPVPVILFGFSPQEREALQTATDQLTNPIAGQWHESRYDHPSTNPEPTAEQLRTAYTLFPKYKILQPTKEIENQFFDMAQDAALTPGPVVLYDGNMVEEWLWKNLQGMADGPTAETPGVVVINGAGRLADSYAYRYTLNNGYMDRVRFFGEFHPQLILDISAEARTFFNQVPLAIDGDPTQPADAPFDSPFSASNTELLTQMLDAASHYRIMQGPGYPATTKPCIAVSVVHAIEIGSALDLLPTERKQNQLIDQAKLNESFGALLAPIPVFTSTKVLVLPDDDPALHAQLTNGPNLRLYLDQNWDKYTVTPDGCQSYLSLFWQPFSGAAGGGVAYYSTQDDRYFSYTNLGEMHRAQYGRQDPSYGGWDWGNDVVAHETGHLLSIRHPFDIDDDNSPFDGYTESFSTIWSTMSYAPENKITTVFSAMDRNNLLRNRVGFMLLEIQEDGLAHGEQFDAGVAAMSEYDWVGASTAFGQILAQQ